MKRKYQLDELSKELSIPRDVILDWEKKGLLRSERSSNSQRVFDLNQVVLLKDKMSGKAPAKVFKVHKSEQTNFSVIELFSGAGGLALGLSNAGLKSKLLVEFDKDAVATLRKNRPEWGTIHEDIRKISFLKHKSKVDIVAGGFPCQSFSYAGNGKGFGDTRGTLFVEFARCVEEVQPKILLAENVRGLINHDGGKTLETILRVFDKLGYRVVYRLLKSQFFDVAQKRERLVIIGIRKDLDIPFIFPKEKDYVLTLRDVIKDCPKSEGATYPEKKKFVMSHVPEGGYWRDLPINLQKEYMKGSFFLGGGKTGMARRLSWDEPSLTLVCTPAQGQTERCHPTETRPLTVREYARIQSFPDNWQFEGSTASKYKQIGNAVPVNLAYYIGRCLIAMLGGKFDPKLMVAVEPLAHGQFELDYDGVGLKDSVDQWTSLTKRPVAELCRA